MQPARVLLSSTLTLAAVLGAASAQAQSARGCLFCGEGVPIGFNLGGLSRWRNDTNQGAFLIGAEASWLRLKAHVFLNLGGYLDTTYDTHAALARSSAGPEVIHVGSFPFGVDLGPLVEWNDTHSHVGLRTRFFIPLVFVTPYVGTTLIALGERSVSLEAGVLLKYPIVWKMPE